MKSALVVWCDVPEETNFVILDKLTQGEFETVKQFHNKFINESIDPELPEANIEKHEKLLDKMNKFFYHDDGSFRYMKHNEMQSTSFDVIIICGFLQ